MAWTKMGSLKGPKGDTGATGAPGKDGTGVTIKGSYANMAALQEAHATGAEGDAYMLEDTGHLAVWDGSQWKDVGQIKGDKGDTGPKGDPGDPGAPGTKLTVTQGAPSEAGADGDVAIDATTGDIYTYEA